MDYKVMGAVLVSLLVLGVGMKTYELDVNDLTDLSNLTDKIGGGEGLDGFKMPSSGKGSTKVMAGFTSSGNVSELDYSGNFRRIRVEGEEITVSVAGFETSDTEVVFRNLSGGIRVSGSNVSVEGETSYLRVGDREFRSERMRQVRMKTRPDNLAVENVSNVKFEFSDVEGDIGLDGQSIALESTPLTLYKFSGRVERNFGTGEFALTGFVSKGEIGGKGSRTVIGN